MKSKKKKSNLPGPLPKILVVGIIIVLLCFAGYLIKTNMEAPLLSPEMGAQALPACVGTGGGAGVLGNLDCRYYSVESCRLDSNCQSIGPGNCEPKVGCSALTGQGQVECEKKMQCWLVSGLTGCTDCKWVGGGGFSCTASECGYDRSCAGISPSTLGFCNNGICYSDASCTVPIVTSSCAASTTGCEPTQNAPGCYPGVQRCSTESWDYPRFVETCQSGGSWAQTDCGVGGLCKYDPGNFPITMPSTECIVCDADGDGYVPAGRPSPCPQCLGADCDCADDPTKDPLGVTCPTPATMADGSLGCTYATSACAICRYPGKETFCSDGVDNDCDGWIDQGGVAGYPADSDCVVCDKDGDGYNPPGAPYPCMPGNDCNDDKAGDPQRAGLYFICPPKKEFCTAATSKCAICIHPAEKEVGCNDGIDNDCDGNMDKGGVSPFLADVPECIDGACLGKPLDSSCNVIEGVDESCCETYDGSESNGDEKCLSIESGERCGRCLHSCLKYRTAPVCVKTPNKEVGFVYECVACKTNGDCKDANYPICISSGACAQCASSSDCKNPLNLPADKIYCFENRCIYDLKAIADKCKNEFFSLSYTDAGTGAVLCGQCNSVEDCSGWRDLGALVQCVNHVCKLEFPVDSPLGSLLLFDGENRRGASRGDTSLRDNKPTLEETIKRHSGKTPWDALKKIREGDLDTARDMNIAFTYDITTHILFYNLNRFRPQPIQRTGTGIRLAGWSPLVAGAYTDVGDKFSVEAVLRPSDGGFGANVQWKISRDVTAELGYYSAAFMKKSDFVTYEGENYNNDFEPYTNQGFVLGLSWYFDKRLYEKAYEQSK